MQTDIFTIYVRLIHFLITAHCSAQDKLEKGRLMQDINHKCLNVRPKYLCFLVFFEDPRI